MANVGGGVKAEKNDNWRGDQANYYTIHRWMRETYGRASKCELEDDTCSGIFQWANKHHKSPRKEHSSLSRDRKDWMELCQSHNHRYDGRKRDSNGRFVWEKTVK